MVHGRISSGQGGIGVIPTFVIVVLDVQVGQFGILNAQHAARVVDVLPVEREFCGLRRNDIRILNQGLMREKVIYIE